MPFIHVYPLHVSLNRNISFVINCTDRFFLIHCLAKRAPMAHSVAYHLEHAFFIQVKHKRHKVSTNANERLALNSTGTSCCCCFFFKKQNRPTYILTLYFFQIDQEEIRPHGLPDFGRKPYVNRRKRSTTHLSQVEVVT